MRKIKLAIVLKFLLQKERITESELARKTGVCQPVIHRMASGETDNPKIETLRPIANFFSISIDQLIGDKPLPDHGPSFHREEPLYYIPLLTLNDVPNWTQPLNTIMVNTRVTTDLKLSSQGYALRLVDSTMYPLFPDNTLLIIEPNRVAGHRDFVIAQLKNHQTVIFKQLLFDGEDRYLKSIDPNYPILKLEKQDKLHGVMLQARIDFSSIILTS